MSPKKNSNYNNLFLNRNYKKMIDQRIKENSAALL